MNTVRLGLLWFLGWSDGSHCSRFRASKRRRSLLHGTDLRYMPNGPECQHAVCAERTQLRKYRTIASVRHRYDRQSEQSARGLAETAQRNEGNDSEGRQILSRLLVLQVNHRQAHIVAGRNRGIRRTSYESMETTMMGGQTFGWCEFGGAQFAAAHANVDAMGSL